MSTKILGTIRWWGQTKHMVDQVGGIVDKFDSQILYISEIHGFTTLILHI